MIVRLLEEYGKFKYLCVLILIPLKILKKLALFMYGVVTKALCGVETDDIITELFTSFLRDYQEQLKKVKEAILYLKVLS